MSNNPSEGYGYILDETGIYVVNPGSWLMADYIPPTKIWDYQVSEFVKEVDGDTWDLTLQKRVDFGFRLIEDKRWSARFRLLGVDTWELKQPRGFEARDYTNWWIGGAIRDGVLRGQTFKTDNFGRWLIVLYRSDTREVLANTLVELGLTKGPLAP